ncbi:hypothetical protein [Wenyingzhuangia fucanilytica]|uniref:hypothetical protein n=1 Tax=Wenyingzhuangia fucanilytica TaxID=1790137 RepID=UPI0012FB0B28|nr:hypothetical protein [Wenyingzhuangia fucanilytica]
MQNHYTYVMVICSYNLIIMLLLFLSFAGLFFIQKDDENPIFSLNLRRRKTIITLIKILLSISFFLVLMMMN